MQTLEQTLDDADFVSQTENTDYLSVCFMLLYYATPENALYYQGLLSALTTVFHIPEETLARYLQVDVSDLANMQTSAKREKIEQGLAHLFTTFMRDPKWLKLNE